MTITIHAIFHAHLDPVWMWPWTAGLDEALATSRSACDRLDAHPDLFYTQGEAWTFAMIERADPALFKRIQAHVEAGRWEIANGWWTQPDCNFPTEEGLRRQILMGTEWVRQRFKVSPRTGFNPDSFGHCAKMPEILRACGQDRYVFMRPQEHELRLPARLFRWQTHPGGASVTAFRIADTYLNTLEETVWQQPIRNALQNLPGNCRHTMSFFGVGDHGGGPTERLIRWVKENRDIIPGARLEFSTIGRFFDAVERDGVEMPEVIGELQMHAIGCYAVVRSAKRALRRAEHALARAEAVAEDEDRDRLADAWQSVLAHQFHDTMGGTSIPEAYDFVDAQLLGAAAVAEEVTAYAIRRQMGELPADPLPRLILANPGGHDFSGWTTGTVYVEGAAWCRKPWRLLDAAGREIPFQDVPSGVGISKDGLWDIRRLLLNTAIPANGLATFRLDLSAPPEPIVTRVRTAENAIANDAGTEVGLASWRPTLKFAGAELASLALHLLDDPSDTWSHDLDRYLEGPYEEAVWTAPRVQDQGPLMASLLQKGQIGRSRLAAEWRVYAGEPWAELILNVHWAERFKVLKLVLPVGSAPERFDGTPGMALTRANDGKERPLQDYTRFGALGVVCPDVFALDATPARVRFTLLRSPHMAHHKPQGYFPGAVVADQGPHRFCFRFFLNAPPVATLAAHALASLRPPLTAELTRGMPARRTEYRSATEIMG
jgi:alpha-mannosidase